MTCFFHLDKYLHDPFVQLWQWQAGPLYVWECDQVCTMLDKPRVKAGITYGSCHEILWSFPWRSYTFVESKKTRLFQHLSIENFFDRFFNSVHVVNKTTPYVWERKKWVTCD